MNKRRMYPTGVWLWWSTIAPLVLVAGFVTVAAITPLGDVPFDGPQYWWMFAAVPLAALMVMYGLWRKRRASARLASPELAESLAARVQPGRQALRAGLIVLALVFLVVAIIGPRWGMHLEKQKVQGIDIAVALDVSRSMLAADVSPNRITKAKQEIRQQLTERAIFRRANRLALVAFAGTTSVKLPLTTDHVAFREKLGLINVGSAPQGGTAITKAIEACADLLARSPKDAAKIILILTDGEDHVGDPVAAAREVFEQQGIRVFTVGVGDPRRTAGAEVPSSEGGKPLIHDGQIVLSKLDVPGLQKIAEAGQGSFVAIDDFRHMVDALAGMKSTQLGVEERQRHQARYQWFVAAALAMLALESLIRESRTAESSVPRRAWLTQEAS